MRPERRVIVYRAGIQKGYKEKSLERNRRNAKVNGATKQCPRCLRFLNFPERSHKSNPKNNIPCIERKD